MRETFTAVLFPFVMCVIVGLMSKVKSKEKKTSRPKVCISHFP